MQGSYEFDSIFILYVSKVIHKLVNGFLKKMVCTYFRFWDDSPKVDGFSIVLPKNVLAILA